MIITEIDSQSINQLNYPVLVRDRSKIRKPVPSKKIDAVRPEKPSRKIKTNITEEKIFEDIEKNTIFIKDSSGKNRKYLIEKVRKLLREKTEEVRGDINGVQQEGPVYFKEEKEVILPEEVYEEEIFFQEEEDEEFIEEGVWREYREPSFSFRDLKEKILDKLNIGSIKKLISNQKEVIESLARASKEVYNFIGNVTENLSSLTPGERMRNMASLKGLMFDALA